ncbi:MAG: hypothetical protein JJE04_17980 [Acidobacteriia bacterium]|nr:hypothetical protein [Terriglobia bacterium]
MRILWVEECYPAAAALQILHRLIPYRDFFFDKPPGAALVHLLWGAHEGAALRLGGALFVCLCCWLIHRFALHLWGAREAWLAAGLLAFFLTFDTPSSVMALAPDLLMLAPHLASVWLACAAMPVAAGAMAGVALLVHTKGVLVLAVCLLVRTRDWLRILTGFAMVTVAALLALALTGALPGYWQQVWVWGLRYAADTFVEDPLKTGLWRTAGWAGFHVALVAGAVWQMLRDPHPNRRLFLIWLAVSLAGVSAGWRFFPRYYFGLLPVMTLAAARGLCLMPRKHALAVAALLAIPLIRFGPRYAQLGADLLAGREHSWQDIDMNQDSRRAAALVRREASSGDTLLVWGYRPDLFVYTRMRAGAPFLDSQPLTGVIADRHLVQWQPSAGGLSVVNRGRLARYNPTFIVDGLGPYNPRLAIEQFPDLSQWLTGYERLGTTKGTVVYRRKR